MTIYFTSDLHWGHRLVSGLRGFKDANGEPDTDAHDAALEKNWRAQVKNDDIVWVLGDLLVSTRLEDEVLARMDALPGRKQLIMGNHDPVSSIHRNAYKHQRKYLEVFESVQAYARMSIHGVQTLLSHYPYRGDGDDHTFEARYTQYRLPDEGLFLIHGHTHAEDQQDHLSPAGTLQLHVGLDAWDLKLVPLSVVEQYALRHQWGEDGPPQ